MADIGPYNLLIGETKDYSASALTFEDSNQNFGAAFADGYAWECLDVLSGPPTVAFRWRHFGKYSGVFTDKRGVQHAGDGRLLNLLGLCIAKVNDHLQIESLEVYYNPSDLLDPLMQGEVVDPDAAIKKAFAKYDKNHTGTIPKQDLIVILKKLCPQYSEAEMDRFFAEIDHDGQVRSRTLSSLIGSPATRPQTETSHDVALEANTVGGQGLQMALDLGPSLQHFGTC